jgi:mRNA interferase HigB
VRVISRRSLRAFWEKHPDVEGPLKAWFREAALAKWQGPTDIKAQYASASFVGRDRVVFNIKGNNYRLIVAIKYRSQIVFIRFVGTHRQYDKVNAAEV